MKNDIDFILKCIEKVKDSRTKFEQRLILAEQFYQADPTIVPKEPDRSDFTTTDLMDEIERNKPAILSDLVGPDKLVSLMEVREEMAEDVMNMELKINYDLKKFNPWFKICSDMIINGMKSTLMVLWYSWLTEKTEIDIQYFTDIDEMQYQSIKNNPDIEIDDLKIKTEKQNVLVSSGMGSLNIPGLPIPPPVMQEQEVKTYTFTGIITSTREGVKIETVSPTDIGFHISESEINTSTFGYRIYRYDEWEIKKQFGEKIWQVMEKRKDELEKAGNNDIIRERFKNLGSPESFMYSDKEGKYLLYDCYYQNPDNGKAWRKIVSGDVEVLDERNKYFRMPAIIASPIIREHAIVGYSVFDLKENDQILNTLLFRQVLENVYQANHRRVYMDYMNVNLDDALSNNSTNAIIRTKGNPYQMVMPEPKGELPSELFPFLSMQADKQDLHGITGRLFAGSPQGSQTRTFKGQNQQMQAGSQKLQLIKSVIAEMIIIPLAREVAKLNIRFLSKEMHLRFFNVYRTINKKNISDEADFTVNIGLGINDRQTQITNLQQMINLMALDLKNPIPIVTPANRYHAAKELYKVMGYYDTANYLTDPQQVQTVQQLLQGLFMLNQQAQQMGVPIPPQIIQIAQKVGAMFNFRPQQMPKQIPNQGTFPGQNVAPQPNGPAQPGQPIGNPDGGGFSA